VVDIGSARPKMKQLGMPEMKPLTIQLAPLYDEIFHGGHLSQLGFLGYMYEICNFSHRGDRTIREIARALSHELSPVSEEHVFQICSDLEELGFMTVYRE
jgi:hypothetical protein